MPQHRANQYASDFRTWDESTRARVLAERIQLGDTREMVYVALGPPLVPPSLTPDQPPRERWETLVFITDPPFPPGATAPLESSPAQPGLRAQSAYNVVWRGFDGPPARRLVIEFGSDHRVAAWRLYPEAGDLFISPEWKPIYMPPSPPAAP